MNFRNWANFFTNEKVAEKIRFIKSRILAVGQELENSEQKLKVFRERNRQLSSPALILDEEPTEELRTELKKVVREKIAPIATPDLIHFTPSLPKTRSGKIKRRILRKIAANEQNQLGDTSTLADPSVVEELINNRLNK